MPREGRSLAVRAVEASEATVLARFALEDHECVIVPGDAVGTVGKIRLGTLTLDGRRYAVLGVPRPPPEPDPIERLTPRELEIAVLIAGGCCNKTIARRLGISGYTVGAHVGRIFAKLDVHKRTELTARIARRIADHDGFA